MAHEDRMLSQEEIDSLLKRILPKTDEPVAKDKPVPTTPDESSLKPKEAASSVQQITSEHMTEMDESSSKPKEAASSVQQVTSMAGTDESSPKPKEAASSVQQETSERMAGTDESSSKLKEAAPSVRPITSREDAPVDSKETVSLGQPQEPIKMTAYKMKAADVTPSSRPVEAVKRDPSSDEATSLQNTVAGLSEQVNKLTTALKTIKQLEERVRQLESIIKLMPDSTRTLKGRIDEISNVLEMLKDENSGSNIFHDFKCSQCRSQGLVAFYVKCTSCGKENWMGWWPDGKKQ